MDLVAIIATIILLATLLTLIFSFAAYVVTRSKALLSGRGGEEKEAGEQNEKGMNERVFFERYTPGETLDIELDSDTGGGEGQWM